MIRCFKTTVRASIKTFCPFTARGSSAAERIKQDDCIYEVHKDKNHIVYATKEKLLKALVDPRTGMII